MQVLLRKCSAALLCLLFAGAALADLDPAFFGPRLIAQDVRIPAPGGYEVAATILRPDGDGRRMILAGQSGGAIVSIFTAGTRQPHGLVAVLSFAGGRGGNPDVWPGVPCAVEAVARVFDALGKQVKVPVLFNYAENDN